jgi:murein DD-endopeptidase MepM/ murein hydrolase activator NlpD
VSPRSRSARLLAAVLLAPVALLPACADDDGPAAPVEECGPFPAWDTSPYVLPFPAGQSYEVRQANCSGFGHTGFWKHGYDFIMPIGTVVTAARAGTVGWAKDGCIDGDQSCTNLITVIHDDGTVAVYSHLTTGGVRVASGQVVAARDTIGRSGNTGYSTEPHLHFSIHPCNELPGLPGARDCPSLPHTFSNTDPNPDGLQPYRWYEAR